MSVNRKPAKAPIKLFAFAVFGIAFGAHPALAQQKVVGKTKLSAKSSKPTQPVCPIEGTWILHNGDKEVPAVRFTFRRDGTWFYKGTDAHSSGRFVLTDKKLTLMWCDVDGEPVTFGSMKKELVLADDNNSYQLDKWVYARMTATKTATAKASAKA